MIHRKVVATICKSGCIFVKVFFESERVMESHQKKTDLYTIMVDSFCYFRHYYAIYIQAVIKLKRLYFNFPHLMIKKCSVYICGIFLTAVLLFSCNETSQKPKTVEIVRKPGNLNKKTNENIAIGIAFALENNGK